MKKFLAILILIFNLSNFSFADDIRDFQIEGISLGNGALDYIDEDKIVKKFWPGSKKYYSFDLDQNSKIKFETYDNMQFIVKNGDKKYKLQGIKGYIYYHNDIKGCLEKMKKVVDDIGEMFEDTNVQKDDLGTVKYIPDKDGKSEVTIVNFVLNSGGTIHIACYDMKDPSLGASGFNVSMGTRDYYHWNITEAFKPKP